MPSPRRSTYRSRTLKSDLAGLRRDGFFHDLVRLMGLGGVAALSTAALMGAALGVVVLFDACH